MIKAWRYIQDEAHGRAGVERAVVYGAGSAGLVLGLLAWPFVFVFCKARKVIGMSNG